MILHKTTNHQHPMTRPAGYAGAAIGSMPARLIADNAYFQHVADSSLNSILSTLAQLTDQTAANKGWILVIGPEHALSKQLLEKHQIDAQRVILINQKQIHRYDNLMRDALTCSTCEAVLSFLPEDHADLANYRYLANKYQTKLLNHSKQANPAYLM